MHRTASSSPKPPFPRSYAPVLRYRSGMLVEEHLPVICESHLDIVVNGKPLATLLCSHTHLRELTCGFLYNEEVIEETKEIVACLIDPHESVARIEVACPVAQSSPVVRSSGFGGTVLLPTPHLRARNDPSEPSPRPCLDSVVEAVRRMQDQATEYTVTRGMHCSALVRETEVIGLFEDIGRHNTFDKLTGLCILNAIDTTGCVLATTGRVSSEMMRKACRLGVAAVASLSGPTDSAIALAQRANKGLLGYVRDGAATIYAGYSMAYQGASHQVVGI